MLCYVLTYGLEGYRKPPTISPAPGLIFDGLILGGAYIYGWALGGLIHGRSFVLVINKSDINKSVLNREINVY